MSQNAGTPRPPPPPGPPPKKVVTNISDSNKEEQPTDKYAKYKKMMDLKISDGDIKEAMENDGLTQRDINRFFEQLFCQFADFSALAGSLADLKLESKVEPQVSGAQAGERAAKYSKMRVMGVSDAAVRSEMVEDKMPPEFIDGFFNSAAATTTPASASLDPSNKKVTETQTAMSAVSSKSGKLPRPRPASSGFSASPGIGFSSTSSRNINSVSSNNNNSSKNQDEFAELNPMRSLSQRGGLAPDQANASSNSSRASAPVFARVPSGSVRMAPLYSSAPHSATVSASSKAAPVRDNVVFEMENAKAQELAKQSDSMRSLMSCQSSSKSLRNVSTVSSKSFKAQMSGKRLGLGGDTASGAAHNQLDFSDMIDEFPAASARKPLAKSISSRLFNMFTGQ